MSEKSARIRYEALSETVRARWLDPAEREFCEQGFEKASLNKILKDANESKGRTYHYFETKGELFRAVLERRIKSLPPLDFASSSSVASSPADYWAYLQEYNARLTVALQTDQRIAALIRVLHQEAAAQTACDSLLKNLRFTVEAALLKGQEIDAIRSDLPIALMVDVTLGSMATIDRWFALNASTLEAEDETRLSARAFSLLRSPLLSSGTSEGKAP